MAVDEERELSDAYRTTKRVRRPEGQGLNDLYVRFFRMAERRIAERTGQGVVCFISNYSWLDGLSFTGMRERYLEAFDAIRIDNLHGDRIISEYAPDGRTSETVFALKGQSPGIKVGTSITLLSKSQASGSPAAPQRVFYRDFHQARAEERRYALLASLAEDEIDWGYSSIAPNIQLGFPFKPVAVCEQWFGWPSLPDLFPVSFPGVKTSRDRFLIDVDLDRLKARIFDYFNPALSHSELERRYPNVMKSTTRYDAPAIRNDLLACGSVNLDRFIRYSYRPFDIRWLYWEEKTKLLDEKRADYVPHVFEGNAWIEARERETKASYSRGTVVRQLADNFGNGLSSYYPMWICTGEIGETIRAANLSARAQQYLKRLSADVEDLFHHVLATLHDTAYREANAGALRMEWPRIPLPGWPDANAPGAAAELSRSAARGRDLAALLDPETPVPGVTLAPLRPELAAIAVPATRSGKQMTTADFSVEAGWGHFGSGDAVMPGQGRAVERAYSPEERAALGEFLPAVGETAFDIHLNENAYWRNVPAAVWRYRLGGYQVLKKWLSYREGKVLGRALHPEEVQYFAETARRIARLLALLGELP